MIKPIVKYSILVVIALVVTIAIIIQGRIPQDATYHNFADDRNLYSIPNFWNVISNLPFLMIGLAGMCFMMCRKRKKKEILLS